MAIVATFVVTNVSGQTEQDEKGILRVEDVMFADPSFQSQGSRVEVSSDALPLWIKALNKPDPELQRLVIDTISVAHRRGMEGLEKTVPRILELAEDEGSSAELRRAAVRAVIEFELKERDEWLVELMNRYGQSLAEDIERSMVRWRSPAMKDEWRRRLKTGESDGMHLLFAVRGIGALEDSESSELLDQIARESTRPINIRLAAANVLGKLSATAGESAKHFADDAESDLVSGLLAVALLQHQEDEAAVDLLKHLAALPETLVKAQAMKRLFEIDSGLLLEFVESDGNHPDSSIRRLISDSMILSGKTEWISPLSLMLDDVNPGLRRHVADAMIQLAKEDSLREAVISEASSVLDRDAWRGCEQATIVLVNLKHLPCGDRLVDLLRHPRGEVMVAAGWGLRTLGDRKHLPVMLGRAQEIYDKFRSREYTTSTPGPEFLNAQLLQAFGQAKFKDAEPLIRKYLPKNFTFGEQARAAAAWAIGFYHLGNAPSDLSKLLIKRLEDVNSMEPELEEVRRMCAISLGRMEAEEALKTLRRFGSEDLGMTAQSCLWSVERITGESPPPLPPPAVLDYDDWFLKPANSRDTEPR